MKKVNELDDSIYPILSYNENKTVISLDVVSGLPLDFDEWKSFMFDFINELDKNGANLFDDDDYMVQDN